MKLREITLDFEQQSRNSIGVALDLLENFVVDIQSDSSVLPSKTKVLALMRT